MRKLLIEFVPGLIGGVVGGVAGYFIVYWISEQGFYAPVLPGALAGLGCGLASRTDSTVRGVLCAIEAVLAGLITQWLVFFNPAEKSLANFRVFLSELPQHSMLTKILLALGVFLGFWWGRECTLRGRLDRPEPRRSARDSSEPS